MHVYKYRRLCEALYFFAIDGNCNFDINSDEIVTLILILMRESIKHYVFPIYDYIFRIVFLWACLKCRKSIKILFLSLNKTFVEDFNWNVKRWMLNVKSMIFSWAKQGDVNCILFCPGVNLSFLTSVKYLILNIVYIRPLFSSTQTEQKFNPRFVPTLCQFNTIWKLIQTDTKLRNTNINIYKIYYNFLSQQHQNSWDNIHQPLRLTLPDLGVLLFRKVLELVIECVLLGGLGNIYLSQYFSYFYLAPNCVWERYCFTRVSLFVFLFVFLFVCYQDNSKSSQPFSMKFGRKLGYH